MHTHEWSLALLAWACLAAVLLAYAGYPVAIAALARLCIAPPAPPAAGKDADLPSVSLLISAYNEQGVIADRIVNAQALDYPRDLLEILVGSDGCTDATAARVRGLDDARVRLIEFAENRGKPSVLNDLAAAARGEILVFTDANTTFDPGALRRLVRWFADPLVGVVCGRLVIVDRKDGRNVDGSYWRYETFLKRSEARLGVVLGANGAIYAVRGRWFRPIPADTLIDDFTIPLALRLRERCRCIYEPGAVAREESAADLAAEFHRRARIGAGGYQAIGRLGGLLHPRQGWYALAFLGHKVLRWLCPFLLIVGLAAGVPLTGHRPFTELWLLLALGCGTAALLKLLGMRPPLPLRLAVMFAGMNAALLAGFWRWLRGRQPANWRRTERPVGAVALRLDPRAAVPGARLRGGR